MRLRSCLPLLLALMLWPACTCQRSENIAAKERLTKPQPKETSSAKATEAIDVDTLTTREQMSRVVHMDGSEIAARLGSFAYASQGELSFGRDDDSAPALKSSEQTTVLQADSGDFAIEVITGDGSEQKLAYVNDIFFLKNGNGKWRVSRDPAGERNTYRTDAMAVWASFYDLVAHALVVERTGATTVGGRPAVGYTMKLPDLSAKARAEGNAVTDAAPPPTIIPGVDGGPDTRVDADEEEGTRRERIAGRVSQWAKRAQPIGGSGVIVVDEATGVPLKVEFSGALLVGDGKAPAKLTVKLSSSLTDIGKAQAVKAPQDAINEVVRRKMPVQPRVPFEEAGVVPPIPKIDPATGAPVAGKPTKPAAPTTGEPPDDE